ncbi:MAG: DUF4358 domain-containing protein [Oscillospiraceae bacterium]|nr:DUF4358 domain-containing protein [Oscillospiraceae bacterium]
MKKLFSLALALVLAFCLCSCGGSDFTLDADALVAELQSAGIFADSSMMAVQEGFLTAEYKLSTDLITDWQAYRGTMITGEDIVVIGCASAADAKVIAEELAAYQTRQYELYSSYSPEGAARIQTACIEQKGAWAVYVAADDAAAAQTILDSYFG